METGLIRSTTSSLFQECENRPYRAQIQRGRWPLAVLQTWPARPHRAKAALADARDYFEPENRVKNEALESGKPRECHYWRADLAGRTLLSYAEALMLDNIPDRAPERGGRLVACPQSCCDHGRTKPKVSLKVYKQTLGGIGDNKGDRTCKKNVLQQHAERQLAQQPSLAINQIADAVNRPQATFLRFFGLQRLRAQPGLRLRLNI